MKPFTVPVVQGCHLLWPTFPGRSYVSRLSPRSLGATCGVAVAFLSYSYLDVSVRCVRSTGPMHSGQSHLSVGLPHSEIRGSQPSYRLLSAYRRFSRPSSPLNAKASITCPFSLGHAYLTPCGARHATAGLCGSSIRARITLLMRRGDSLLEIVLGVQINLAHPVEAQLRKPKAAHVSRSQRPTLHLSKIPPACAVGGSRMIVSSPVPSRGWGARTPELCSRCSYQPVSRADVDISLTNRPPRGAA